jgi:hypothetical protein
LIGWIDHDRVLLQANMTTPSLESLVTTYILAIRQFGEDYLYDSLKDHYSDDCSNGDVVINEIIDTLHNGRHNSPYLLIQALRDIQDVERYIYHPDAVMKIWMKKNECTADPFWAS